MSWYERIKESAKEQGLSVGDLIALAPKNDPFYTGRPAEKSAARWFAEIWGRFNYQKGVHLRRIHYRLVSQDPPINKPMRKLTKRQLEEYDGPGRPNQDGTVYEPYLNTHRDWQFLNNAAKWARYLGLVDVEAFIDQRNKDPIVENAEFQDKGGWWYDDPKPDMETSTESWNWSKLPDLPTLPSLDSMPGPPALNAKGYDSIEQEFLVEVWVEKTTMDDVLMPVCRSLKVNLVRGAGELSITMVMEFMRRVQKADRPARILYISDYDPAGLGMPISVSRKIEYFQRSFGFGDLDIRLQPILLTKEQVEEYRLPRTPVKETDTRKAQWEMDHGEGQVELDAMEALHEGELANLTREEILKYIDPDLQDEAEEVKGNLQADLDERTREVVEEEDIGEVMLAGLEEAYRDLRHRWKDTVEEFADMVEPFQEKIDEYSEEMESIKRWGEAIHAEIKRRLEEETLLEPEEEYPLPEPDIPDEEDTHLYIGDRDYIAQLTEYKRYRHGIA